MGNCLSVFLSTKPVKKRALGVSCCCDKDCQVQKIYDEITTEENII